MKSHFLRATKPATVSYVTSNAILSTTSTYTFSTQSIGTAQADRVVYVAIGIIGGNLATTSNVTIAGTGASKLIEVTAANNSSAIWALAVPTGTTATIVVTTSANCTGCSIAIYSANNVRNITTANATNSLSTAKTASTLDLLATGAGFAIGYMTDDNSTGASWTGLTSNVNNSSGVISSWRNAASANFTTSGNKAISASFTGGAGAVASFATIYVV